MTYVSPSQSLPSSPPKLAGKKSPDLSFDDINKNKTQKKKKATSGATTRNK